MDSKYHMSERYDCEPLRDFDVVLIKVPGDGHCFFHSVMLGAIDFYINHPHKRTEIVINIRKMLANYLQTRQPNGQTAYDTLSRGELKEYAKFVPQAQLPNLVRLLQSSECVGLEVLEATSNLLDLNIIMWDKKKKDIYRHGDKELLFKPDRTTVVILYHPGRCDVPGKRDIPGHYDLLGIRDDANVYTHFTSRNPFIRYLNSIW